MLRDCQFGLGKMGFSTLLVDDRCWRLEAQEDVKSSVVGGKAWSGAEATGDAGPGGLRRFIRRDGVCLA